MRISSFEGPSESKEASEVELIIPNPEKNLEAYQYYMDHFLPPKEGGEFKIKNGRKYEKKATRWTIARFSP